SFSLSELVKKLHSKVFLELDYETMKTRRSLRQYEIPDAEGYFDKYVYPVYLDIKTELTKEPQDVPIHGTNSKEHVYAVVMNVCHNSIKKDSMLDVQVEQC
ncbi:hypothetical protein Ciccas_011630, partial [Cichlidogyrus casuarinus]